ncbi:MAG TPA: NAD(P)-dependent oxidoreductase [Candidatus Paceibacterota bacterium]|nr:NAD(P)-dependent oxidoreductase [Candidatus Paceibacterota bacterium]
MQHTVLITGAAGYVGTMLVRRFAARGDVAVVIGLDKEPVPDLIKDEPKLVYIERNTADEWEGEVAKHAPDIIVHAAWQIRAIYNNEKLTWKWNIEGSDKVFAYAFSHPEVARLVHFSTVASYGAFPDNTLEHRFTEDEPFRKTDYLYAEEKRIAEERLQAAYERSDKRVAVSIIRPAAITGPRGRFMRIRFGLQAALSGSLKGQRSFVYDLVSLLVSWVPVTKKWLRQFIHEDDIVGLVERLTFGPLVPGYEIFNACPPGPAVLGKDMAKAVGKRTLPVYPWMIRIAYFLFWHLTRGKIPSSRGSWKSYSYPIAVDGAKATNMLGYAYRYNSFDAFYYTNGEYESYVPEALRRHKA